MKQYLLPSYQRIYILLMLLPNCVQPGTIHKGYKPICYLKMQSYFKKGGGGGGRAGNKRKVNFKNNLRARFLLQSYPTDLTSSSHQLQICTEPILAIFQKMLAKYRACWIYLYSNQLSPTYVYPQLMPHDLKPGVSKVLPEDDKKGYQHKSVFAKYAVQNSLLLPHLCYIHRNVILVSKAMSSILSGTPSRCFMNTSRSTVTDHPILSLEYKYFKDLSFQHC